jgi:hypothetical protein
MDPSEYQANTCNVLCVRGVPASEVVALLDREWEQGTVHLRASVQPQKVAALIF